eukprot:CAMPEP_0195136148 /NCGR_PEP_ID=MMETSP0448-20130528/153729_1 /TAXON_ID=66468 /ORGANISM="Heterocapsa triquestra, Strain CCMP 448" /LENGTH=128 /DNA_ID=CAMNT_0040174319 /DNA_START=33 /DNA_END=416 /DNA_ORIENTATION=+
MSRTITVTEANPHSHPVPAGVEEVTAIALLQHLRGPERARAVLLRLPPELRGDMSWQADWGDDEGRRQWHEQKMQSKVSRPRAQLKSLFRGSTMHLPEVAEEEPEAQVDEPDDASPHAEHQELFGTVL